jgi:hypothetical protein
VAALLAASALPAPVRADGSKDEGFKQREALEADQQLGWMAGIARAEHARQVLDGVAEYIVGGYPKEVRWRAIVALGRIGNDATGVRILRRLLRQGGEDLVVALWSAGLTGEKALVPDVLPHLETKDPEADPQIVAHALEAVGRLGDARAVGYVRPFLDHGTPRLRALGLDALVRMKAERELETVLLHAKDADPEVRRAVAAAAWRLSGARRKALSTEKAPWPGDERLARSVGAHDDADPRRGSSRIGRCPSCCRRRDGERPRHGERPDAVALAGVADQDRASSPTWCRGCSPPTKAPTSTTRSARRAGTPIRSCARPSPTRSGPRAHPRRGRSRRRCSPRKPTHACARRWRWRSRPVATRRRRRPS